MNEQARKLYDQAQANYPALKAQIEVMSKYKSTKVAKLLFSILINGKNVSLLFIPINPTHNYQHLKFCTFHNKCL